MPITNKKYKCPKCGNIQKVETNHFGSGVGKCSKCGHSGLVCIEEDGIRLSNQLNYQKKDQKMRLPESVLTKNQKKTFTKKIMVDGKKGRIDVTIRYDDNCGNGHNSFSITGTIFDHETSTLDRHLIALGCIHDEIEKHFPEFRHLIKWHLTSSDGPMHYTANTMYHARDRTHQGKEIGDPVAFETFFKFDLFPFTFKEHEKGFWDYLDGVGDFNNIEVVTIPYDGGGNYDYSPNFSLTGFIKENEQKQWYKAPFKDKKSADEFLSALRSSSYHFVKVPIKFCEPVIPDIEAARSCSVWPEATPEQLRDESELKKRLPALMEEFKKDIESFGFIY